MNQGTNVMLHAAVGGLLAAIFWAVDHFAGVKVPAEIAMGVGTAIETVLLFALPADLLKKGQPPTA